MSGGPAMAAPRRVVVTGAGVVSALGCTPGELWDGLCSDRSGVGPVTRFDPGRFRCRVAAQVDDGRLRFDGAFAFELKRMSAFVRYALFAAEQAVAASGIPVAARAARGRVFLGVAMGGLPSVEAGVMRQEARGPRHTTPFLIPSLIPSMAASMIALRLPLTGPQCTIAGACASGSQALGEARRSIRDGHCDWAVAGGAEAVTTPITYSGFEAMAALSLVQDPAATPRPFDARRDGMVVGEGAAAFLLEERSHALARGAPILGELTGFATNSGGGDLTAPSADHLADCMAGAVADAELEAADVDAVFAQASGMVVGDAREMDALQKVFGGRSPAVTSIKGHVGYLFAGNGPLGLAAALLALRAQALPPTRNFQAVEPAYAGLDVVAEPRPMALRRCLINAFGFGGINASLVVSLDVGGSEPPLSPTPPTG
ncbi:MAG TPA: beta-ketoacyl-[acyl-carrier-protein] synthase family protein [Methylomirabilota bacterium]|nr:beta-ketoacyl-[acyl-carrier-protein] synthase family protein [Methylomirabilota bacterium]